MAGDPYEVELNSVADLPTTTLALFTLFSHSFILFAFSSLSVKEPEQGKGGGKITAVTLSRQALHPLFREFSELGIIIAYIWCCENRPIFDHGDKWHDLDFFYFLMFGVIVGALLTVRENHNDVTDLLNRDQTEEWKGWMQVFFLLYHYFHVSEVYNAVRVMISCYVWMTGFGNFSFFYIKRDFSFVRFYQMMWRLNFLVFFLCWSTNNLYILYYICPLHTFYFLLTFGTMYVYSSINHTKYAARVKLMLVGVGIFLVWEYQQVFDLVFWLLPTDRHEGYAVGGYGIQYEWHFRSGLDHYSTFFGMIFAMNFPQAALWLNQVESGPPLQNILVKGCTAFFLLMASYFYYAEVYTLPKLEYNALHPYVFIFPLSCYIFIRNSSKYLRGRRSVLLETIGKVTLETYLLQHHVWLTSNAKTLLVFLPNYPRLNFLVVTVIYFLISKRLYRLTINLRARCIPENEGGALLSFSVLVMVFSVYFILAWTLQKVESGWWLFFLIVGGLGLSLQLVLEKSIKHGNFLEGELKKKINIYGFCVWALIFASVALLLMNFNATNGYAADIGPFRPSLTPMDSNLDVSCLSRTQDYVIREFDFRKIEHEKEMFVNERSIFRFEQTLKEYHFPRCRTRMFSSAQVASVIRNKRILFVGQNQMRALRRSFINSFGLVLQTRHQYLAGEKGKIHHLQSKELNLTLSWARNFGQVAAWDVIVFDLSSIVWATKEVGDYYYQDTSSKHQTPLEAISTLIRTFPVDQAFVLVTPYAEEDFNPGISERLSSGEIPNKRIGIVDIYRLTSKPGLTNLDVMNRIAPQLLVNNLAILFNTKATQGPRILQAVTHSTSPSKVKGSGGGIAANPAYGFCMLVLSAIMLILSDNYFGMSFLCKRIFGEKSVKVTWEESVRLLHERIGIQASTWRRKQSSTEEDESFIKK